MIGILVVFPVVEVLEGVVGNVIVDGAVSNKTGLFICRSLLSFI
jgi:hypothetical protein